VATFENLNSHQYSPNTKIMKKIVMIAIAITLSLGASAQIENLYSKDSTVCLNGVYAGVLNLVNFDLDTLKTSTFTDFRVGAKGTWSATSWLRMSAFSVYAKSNEGDAFMNMVSLNLHTRNEVWNLEVGKIPTSATEIRPIPLSSDGQFEAQTQALIPGIAPGAKISYAFNKNNKKDKLVFGVFSRDNKVEYSGRMVMGKVNLFTSYSLSDKKTTAGASYSHKRLYALALYQGSDTINGDKVAAVFTNFKILPRQKIDVFLNGGYSLKNKDIPHLEIGMVKNFETPYLKGLIGVIYDHRLKAVKSCFMVSLGPK